MTIKRVAINPLMELISKIKTNVFDVRTQYNFIKLYKALEQELEIIGEQEKQLLELYAEKDENGEFIVLENGGYKIISDKLSECQQKVIEMDSVEIVMPDIKFTLDELQNLGLSMEELLLLDDFIKL